MFLDKIILNKHWIKVQDWYRRYERPASSISLVGGFVFDAITLNRVDELWENIWVAIHLIVVAAAILILNIKERENKGGEISSTQFWLINILQFFFGGLLSTYIVFYFRSTTLTATWPFLFLLVVAFMANESLKRHYARLVFQISLLFLSLFSFTIFCVPIILQDTGPKIFALSGAISLVIMGVFLYILKVLSKRDFHKEKYILFSVIFFIFALINGLYFTHLIPPLPLALKDGGIYHLVERNASGNYDVLSEGSDWHKYIKLYDRFYASPGSPVYAYSAIFSPNKLDPEVVHEWQHYDLRNKKWITLNRIHLSVLGGRDGGFRTYSVNYNLPPGRARVNVLTNKGELIGRLQFELIRTDINPNLKLETLE